MNIEYGKQNIKHGTEDISVKLFYFRIMQQSLREMCSDGDMEVELGCDRVLLSSQSFKRRVNTILDITSFDWFSLDIPKELEGIFDSSLSRSG